VPGNISLADHPHQSVTLDDGNPTKLMFLQDREDVLDLGAGLDVVDAAREVRRRSSPSDHVTHRVPGVNDTSSTLSILQCCAFR